MTVIRKNLLKRLPIILMVMLLALVISPAMVSAEEANENQVIDDGGVGENEALMNEEPAFQNTSQALKAERVADAAALNDSGSPPSCSGSR